MQRRDFFKISAVTGAAAALDSCGNPEHQLIRFIPEEDLVPGVATWKPSLCTLCPAGCGLLVRVMEGEAEVVRNGKLGLMEMGLAKKLEGNPHHPVNRGKLCPRGQAGLQVTYHPDRLRNPLKRSGARGAGEFREISWDDAIQELASQLSGLRSKGEAASLAFLTQPLRGQRRELVERFLKGFGSAPPVTFELLDQTVLRHANARSFGQQQLPTLDLGRCNYVISFGADFLGAWNSPVAQSIAYGEMRQGRSGLRGKFVQVEPRLSQTGANADEWIAARPGREGVLALGLAHVIQSEKLRDARTAARAGAVIEGWSQGLPDYAPAQVEKESGVPAATIARLAHELASHEPALAVIGGAPLAQTNGLFSALAVNVLNALLGSVGQPGGIVFTPKPPISLSQAPESAPKPDGGFAGVEGLMQQILLDRPHAAKVLLLYNANPAFALPASLHVREALQKVPYLASFNSFLDETSTFADLVLPDHSPLESWLDNVAESGATQWVASLAPPALLPLHNTRAMPDVLLEVAHQLGGKVASALPWKNYEELLHAAFESLRTPAGAAAASSADDFWNKAQQQGGWWGAAASGPAAPPDRGKTAVRNTQPASAPVNRAEPQFDGAVQDFPFHFLPYASQTLYDGSLAHLPWMQETPDPLSTAMWGTWVEINPRTAERLNVRQGDLVEVRSSQGKLRAPALLSPGVAPDVVAMPVGQGHENFGRYATGRGANPLSILAPLAEPGTGSFAWAATRVQISRVGKGKLALFAGGIREKPFQSEPR
jgi:menaquinone reductase, molybdopterin-binding-like subunit